MKCMFNGKISVSALTLMLIIAFSCGEKKDEKAGADSIKQEQNTAGSNTDAPASTESAGKSLFYMKSKENNIACADCHSDGTNDGKALTKYFSNIQGADKRTSTYHGKFKGADVPANAGGATVCWEAYMKMKTPLTTEQITDLNNYYSTLKPSEAVEEIKYETIALPEKDKAKLKIAQKNVMALTGNSANGKQTFEQACGMCHGQNKTVKKVPDVFDDFEGNVKSITYNVRFGDGAMPFFKESVLTDQELADIAAYILEANKK